VRPASSWPVALLALILLISGCGSARRGEPVVGPVALSPAAMRGEQVFMRNCHECHPKGEGGLARSINDKPLPDFLIGLQVRHGLGAMPEFGPNPDQRRRARRPDRLSERATAPGMTLDLPGQACSWLPFRSS
jgi:mono/diheme cytochrome c family protein